jgi:hypothetical protein
MLFGFVLPGYEFTDDLDAISPNGRTAGPDVPHRYEQPKSPATRRSAELTGAGGAVPVLPRREE